MVVIQLLHIVYFSQERDITHKIKYTIMDNYAILRPDSGEDNFDQKSIIPCEEPNDNMKYRTMRKRSPRTTALFKQAPEIKYSDEQKAIIDAFQKYDKIRINAYAGSGKTTTLLEIARNYPNEKFLMLCFNKSVSEEIQYKTSAYGINNIVAKTIHAIAYHNLMRLKGGKIRVINTADMIKRLSEEGISPDIREIVTSYKVYEAFCNSEYIDITYDNIKRLIRNNRVLYNTLILAQAYSISKEYEKKNIKCNIATIINQVTNEVVNNIVSLVQEIDGFLMSRKCDVITHAAYLKALHRHVSRHHEIPGEYTALMIDEAQDINGIMINIIENLDIPKKIAVGDKHQSIYGWNGAINALSQLSDWEEFYLTTSFRFKNPEIIELANSFLTNIKYESRLMRQCENPKELSGFAYITRTNAQIMEHIAKIEGPFKLNRPLDSIFESLLIADQIIKYYSKNEKPGDKVPEYIKKIMENCTTFDNFIETIKLVDAETHDTINKVYQMANRGIFVKQVYVRALQNQDEKSNYTITTAHTAKGLEYKEIEIAGDFMTYVDLITDFLKENKDRLDNLNKEALGIKILEGHKDISEIMDQINLQYVAITRASEVVRGEGLQTIKYNFSKTLKSILSDIVVEPAQISE